MPPNIKTSRQPSSSKDLISLGSRDLTSVNQQSKSSNRALNSTTARALVLRNGKYGSQGTGELILSRKISGREKLDLLAEDLVRRASTAVMTPFNLEKCEKIIGSQYQAGVDAILALKDPALFSDLITAEVKARPPLIYNQALPLQGLLKDPSHVASIVGTSIHNAYMLTAAWGLALDTIEDLVEAGLNQTNIKARLNSDAEFRLNYLVLHDITNILVELNQKKVSVLATTSDHFRQYFKISQENSTNEPIVVFDWGALRAAGTSFLDSIIIELCFPQAPYPQAVLYQVLHDAVEESPREAKRFPQALWDAVGDLSDSVELQQLVEAPLLTSEGEKWRKSPRRMTPAYYDWVKAQEPSEKASSLFASYKDIIYPLSKTGSKNVLDEMWTRVNKNYVAVSGLDANAVWGFASHHFHTVPRWHPSPIVGQANDSDGMPRLVGSSKNKKKPRKPLQITDHAADDTDPDMPSLLSPNASSSEDGYSSSDESSDEVVEDEEDEDISDGYNTEDEDEIRELLREAMDAAIESGVMDQVGGGLPEDDDPFKEDRKGNPFLKILGSLRGRMFSSSPKLKTTTPTRAGPAPPTDASHKDAVGLKPVVSGLGPSKAAAPQSLRTTVEDVEDEDDVKEPAKKKKKKPKKKKKKATQSTSTYPTEMDSPEIAQASVLPAAPKPTTEATTKPPPTAARKVPPTSPKIETPTSPKVGIPTSPKAPTRARQGPTSEQPPLTPSIYPSTSTLTLPVEPTLAQSARSYLNSENLLEKQKSKVKSRPDHASLAPIPEKKSFFSRVTRRKDKETEDPINEVDKRGVFSKLRQKTKVYMHQLLGTAEDAQAAKPMKWENFLKIMREMGFTYEPSTAGSSVRFDPPNPKDHPISFHKPHPDTTIRPHKVKEYAKRLKAHYGWDETEFIKFANESED